MQHVEEMQEAKNSESESYSFFLLFFNFIVVLLFSLIMAK